MKKILLFGAIIVLFGANASNGRKVNSPPVKRRDLATTMDSLQSAARKLENSTARMSNSLSNIK